MNHQNASGAALQRGLEFLQAKTPAERVEFLKEIGILNAAGELAERYRAGGPATQPNAAAK